MDTCQDVMRRIYPYLDGELDVEATGRVQTHLQECARCRDAFTSEHAFLELVRSQATVTPTPTKVCSP
jgi:mycothiol system anti-sigma-R factor